MTLKELKKVFIEAHQNTKKGKRALLILADDGDETLMGIAGRGKELLRLLSLTIHSLAVEEGCSDEFVLDALRQMLQEMEEDELDEE